MLQAVRNVEQGLCAAGHRVESGEVGLPDARGGDDRSTTDSTSSKLGKPLQCFLLRLVGSEDSAVFFYSEALFPFLFPPDLLVVLDDGRSKRRNPCSGPESLKTLPQLRADLLLLSPKVPLDIGGESSSRKIGGAYPAFQTPLPLEEPEFSVKGLRPLVEPAFQARPHVQQAPEGLGLGDGEVSGGKHP